MSLTAAMIDALVASGATAEMLAAVMKASLAEQDDKLAQKRANDAKRQRAHRERNAVSRDVTVTGCDKRDDTPPPLSSPPLSPQTPNNPPPIIPPTPVCVARKRAVRCPDDWQPKPLPVDLASEVAAMPVGWLERQLAGMRDWSAASPNGAKLDWDATWRGWLRRTMKEPNNGNGMGRNNGQGAVQPQYRRQPGWEAFKRLRGEHLTGIDEAGADEGTRSGDDGVCYPLALPERH